MEGGQEREEGGRETRPCPPQPAGLVSLVTLARMSMVAQVSMSCMDTGVCPSALASRISTSCSAFSLNVSMKLTRELGKRRSVSPTRTSPARDFPAPSLQGGHCG